jgi:hypothetical protein
MKNHIVVNRESSFDVSNIVVQRPFKNGTMFLSQAFHLNQYMCVELEGARVVQVDATDEMMSVHLQVDRSLAALITSIEDSIAVHLTLNMKHWFNAESNNRTLIDDNLVRCVYVSPSGKSILRVSVKHKPEHGDLQPDTTVRGAVYIKGVRVYRHRIGLDFGEMRAWSVDTGRSGEDDEEDEDDDEDLEEDCRPSRLELRAVTQHLQERLRARTEELAQEIQASRSKLERDDELHRRCVEALGKLACDEPPCLDMLDDVAGLVASC